MQVLDCGPLKYDINELEKRFSDILNYRKIDFERLIEKTQGLVEPRAVYTYVEVAEIEGDNVHLRNGAKFKSIILGDLLKQGQNVAPYVATIGFRLDDELSKLVNDSTEISLYVDIDRFQNSLHGDLECIDCHSSIDDVEHDTELPEVNCGGCH